MLEDLEKLDLSLEGVEHALLALLVVRVAGRELYLLDGHEGPAHRVHAQVD